MTTHGVLARFATPERLLDATRLAREAGYAVEAYTPMPVEGLSEAVGFRGTILPWVVLFGGVAGAASAYALQYYASAVDYPLNVGGRPLASWPAFTIVAFEMAILAASLSCVVGMFIMNGLPRPHHPVFNVPAFSQASRTGFFLCLEAADPDFNADAARAFLERLRPEGVWNVEA